MQSSIENNQEKLSDQEKLKEVQSFIIDMNETWFEYGPVDRTIIQSKNMLQMDCMSWEWTWSYLNYSLVKNWKEVFSYSMKSDPSYKENWKPRQVWITIKIDWKTMNYSGDWQDEHWLFDNFHLLEWAKKYKKEIDEIIAKDKAKREKEQKEKELNQNNSNFKSQLDKLQSEIN